MTKNSLSRLVASLASAPIVVLPMIASAQRTSESLKNPLAFPTIQEFLLAILNILIVIATPIVVLFIILAGFKYVTARGNPTTIQEASRALMYGIIGAVIIVGAVAIVQIIENLVRSFQS